MGAAAETGGVGDAEVITGVTGALAFPGKGRPGVFLAGADFAGAFLGGAFLTRAFLAGAFLAGVFLAGAFLATGLDGALFFFNTTAGTLC